MTMTVCSLMLAWVSSLFLGDSQMDERLERRLLERSDALLNQAMLLLAAQPRALFLGQNVAYDGNVMFKHLDGVPMAQRLELPVCEELQMGMSIGLALQGFLPISVYPRMDFLLLAMNQLVNHLDKLPYMSRGQYSPKVIIRTKVGSKHPLNAGPQHTQDHTEAFRAMLTTVAVERITEAAFILPAYQRALDRSESTLIVENLEGYHAR